MHHSSILLLSLSLGAVVEISAAQSDWCYTGCDQSPSNWGGMAGSFCGAKGQSPVDLVTGNAQHHPELLDFAFANFSSRHAIASLINNGHTAQCTLKDGVEVSGGGLNGTYSAVEFHFHWGDTDHHPGSEHTLDGHRYPMEMQIVSRKKGLTEEQAVVDPQGIAVLAFFIDAMEDGDLTGPWNTLASKLNKIGSVPSTDVNVSIDDLIGNASLAKFYRYMGSLTTPGCNETVVWTVFHEPIGVHKNLINLFPVNTGLVNVYRPVQDLNDRQVFASPATPLPQNHEWCYEDNCAYNPARWNLLSPSCGGDQQSPVDIDSKSTVVNQHLDALTFTKFDDKHSIKYITNTGHSVKCVLKDDLVELSGGGLGYTYSTLQFHFHWGSNTPNSQGSEHTVDSKRYPMAMHIVHKRKDLTLDQAVNVSNGLAVLGFFIEPLEMTKSDSRSSSGNEETSVLPAEPSSSTEAWTKLTNLLSAVTEIGSKAEVVDSLSIDDLLGDVDRSAYFRYNGSLTTPMCNEAVVWTIFKDSVKVDRGLMALFPTQAGYRDVFRPAQSLHSRTIYTTSAAGGLAPIALLLPLAWLCTLASL